MPDETPRLHSLHLLELDKALSLVARRCSSAGGRRRIQGLLPIRDGRRLASRQADVAEWIALCAEGPVLPCEVPELGPLTEKIRTSGAVLDARELLRIAAVLEAARIVAGFLRGKSALLQRTGRIARELVPHDEVRKRIERALEPGGAVRDEASADLRRIRRRIEAARKQARTLLESLGRRSRGDDLTATLRNDRFVLQVPRTSIRDVPGIVHDRSATGATLYVEPLGAVGPNNELHRRRQEEEREVARILAELSSGVRAVADDLIRNEDLLVEVDTLHALGLFAREYGGRFAGRRSDGGITIVRGRHPLLVHQYRDENREKEVVPLDLELGAQLRALLITGPNTGGKTVALKTIGLLCALDRSGVPIPCAPGTSFPDLESFHADIGDEQSIEDHLSTFASHVRNLAVIADDANERSLVLLDELGGATDPEEGAALARAVLDHLARAGALTLATTHSGDLKAFAHERPALCNASMEFDAERAEPLYRLRVGVPGASHGLATARALGLPPSLVDAARGFLGAPRVELDALIGHLEEERERAVREGARARAERERLERERAALEARLRELEAIRREASGVARREFAEFLAEARRTLEREVETLRTRGADRESNLAARRALERLGRELEARTGPTRPPSADPVPPGLYRPGETVFVPSLGKQARVVEVREGGERLLVESGALRFEVRGREVETGRVDTHVQWKQGDAPDRHRPSARSLPGHLGGIDSPESTEVMVRGLSREDALEVVDRFLDRCVASGLETVRIIHGVGEGILRRAIEKSLRGDSRVASFRLGELGEGGLGVTVVTLR